MALWWAFSQTNQKINFAKQKIILMYDFNQSIYTSQLAQILRKDDVQLEETY